MEEWETKVYEAGGLQFVRHTSVAPLVRFVDHSADGVPVCEWCKQAGLFLKEEPDGQRTAS